MKFTFSAGDQPLEGMTIKRAIHRGGFGEVYYALTDAGKEVAIKLLHDNMEIELRGVSQCLNLSHPNLVTIFDVKTDADGDYWILMEYISGNTLAEAIEKFPNGMSSQQASQVLQQACEGLGFLHDRGLVHRDLKPANIFWDHGQLKIADVGLSKFISASQRSAHTQSVGTVYYMAPEVARGRYGPGVDIYAMGIIAFEMLTGQVPFDGESTGEILMKHLTEPPKLDMLDPKLQPVIGKALAKEETERFQTIQEFEAAFSAAVNGQAMPVSSRLTNHDGVKIAMGPADQTFQDDNLDATVRDTHPSVSPKRLGDRVVPVLAGIAGMMILFRIFPNRLTWLSMLAFGLCLFLGMRLFRWARSEFQASRGEEPNTHRFGEKVHSTRRVAKPLTPTKYRSFSQRMAQTLSAIARTPFYIILMTAAVLFVSRDFFSSQWSRSGFDLGHITFFVLSSCLATWVLLGFTQLWSRGKLDHSRFRIALAVAGIATGTAVSGLHHWLLVEYPNVIFPHGKTGIVSHIGRHDLAEPIEICPESPAFEFDEIQPAYVTPVMMQEHGEMDRVAASEQVSTEDTHQSHYHREDHLKTIWAPTMVGYATFFGILFSIRSWWLVSDYRRNYRYEFSSIIWSAFTAYIICIFFTFPLVWGITWAATITAALQLAAPMQSRNIS
ncbi:serine/threonine-protein kinase [Rubinisphaera sp.]|uniref:serine/threonine protein kinase n=1 Tax=Rubinisphaera sp. TaxID=2024857 RepID=UPI000C104ECE|nr:serine/threonine-protein kinase [Rubinisphaera sp.]MBV09716.1 hypothetical protein [Rubinisphaera sp.]|tara:strand:+ start:883 stop:2883 length:2001 start_codon:yes stop_codon:yes gene_type:complete